MRTKQKNNIVFIRLFSGEDIFEELKKACKKHDVKTAVVLSGLGQLKNFQLGYFKEKGDYVSEEFNKPYELLSMSGNIISPDEEYFFHVHVTLGDENKKAVGGHLISGIVEVTSEIILLKVDVNLNRTLDEKTGLKLLDL